MADISLRERLNARSAKSASDPFSILFVCTGNICRSPLAEQLVTARVASVQLGEFIRASSAGTQVNAGQSMPPEAAQLSAGLGGDPTAHGARGLSTEMIVEADIILGLAREHRSAVVRLSPRAASRTFTLIEFSRLIASAADTGERMPEPTPEQIPTFLRAMVDKAAGQRGLAVLPTDLSTDDVIDPYRRSVATYQKSADQIVGASSSILESLTALIQPAKGSGSL